MEGNSSHPQNSYFFFNLGCPKNLVDAERTAARLEEAGWRGVGSPRDASLLIVTTCAFIAKAEEESINEILRLATQKEEWQWLVVLGCLVTREGAALQRLLPEVDLFLGIEEMEQLSERLGSIVLDRRAGGGAGIGERILFTPSHLAYLKIAEGCSNHCSYCLIPSMRGELRSRDRDEILGEAAHLVEAGVRELVIIAQDTGAWRCEYTTGSGRTRSPRLEGGSSPPSGEWTLYDLLEDLSTVGAEWLRLLYLHPAHIDVERLLALIESGAICPYLDIPVQHASDRILDLMGRGYTRADLHRIFGTLRTRSERIVLRTTVMVGYPGETDSDFEELLHFLDEISFDHVGVFTFSPEKGTKALSQGPSVEEEERCRRRDEVLALQMDISHERLAARVGTVERILVDEVLGETERPSPSVWGTGRFYGQAYEVDGFTYLSGTVRDPGTFVSVYIYNANAYDLFASVL